MKSKLLRNSVGNHLGRFRRAEKGVDARIHGICLLKLFDALGFDALPGWMLQGLLGVSSVLHHLPQTPK